MFDITVLSLHFNNHKTFRKMKEVIDMLLQEVRNINGALDLLYPERDEFYHIGKKLTQIDDILSQIEE